MCPLCWANVLVMPLAGLSTADFDTIGASEVGVLGNEEGFWYWSGESVWSLCMSTGSFFEPWLPGADWIDRWIIEGFVPWSFSCRFYFKGLFCRSSFSSRSKVHWTGFWHVMRTGRGHCSNLSDPAVVLLGAVDVHCFLGAPLQVGFIWGPGFVKLWLACWDNPAFTDSSDFSEDRGPGLLFRAACNIRFFSSLIIRSLSSLQCRILACLSCSYISNIPVATRILRPGASRAKSDSGRDRSSTGFTPHRAHASRERGLVSTYRLPSATGDSKL